MSRTVTIDPVTRIEGHARITLELGDAGEVRDARFHLTQFRGFEKFCEGRPYREMPALTARTCGICPVSHILASNKACDDLLSVSIPPTAEMLRRVMNLAQLTQSHALSFFHLSSPDLLLGWDTDPASRNIFGVMRQHPALAKDGIEAEIIDLRTLSPLDIDTVIESVEKTGYLVCVDEANPRCSIAADISAQVAQAAFKALRGPIQMVTAPHTPVPFSPVLEDLYIPSAAQIGAAVKRALAAGRH